MVSKGICAALAQEVEADLVLWVLNRLVLMPDLLSAFLSQLLTVSAETGLFGFL